MNILIRTDSSHNIGIGHVMRCLVLAETLRDQGHLVTFMCRELPGNINFHIESKRFSLISLPYNEYQQALLSTYPLYQQWLGEIRNIDLQQTLNHLARINPLDWLIFDHYGLDLSWESEYRNYTKKILVIDDLADRKHDCDILLDQNYYQDPSLRYHNLAPDHCNTLIGPHYALIRSEFIKARKNITSRRKKVQRLMVSLGGSDKHNGTEKILIGIQHLNRDDIHTDVVLGATSPNKNIIHEFCATHKNFSFHCPATNMAKLMLNADLAIGSGGSTTWERCCLGLPSLVVNIADNQNEIIRQGLSIGIFDYLGEIHTLQEYTVTEKLNDIIYKTDVLQAMSNNGMRLVDGLGAQRVVKQMESLKH